MRDFLGKKSSRLKDKRGEIVKDREIEQRREQEKEIKTD